MVAGPVAVRNHDYSGVSRRHDRVGIAACRTASTLQAIDVLDPHMKFGLGITHPRPHASGPRLTHKRRSNPEDPIRHDENTPERRLVSGQRRAP